MFVAGAIRANWLERLWLAAQRPRMRNLFRYFNSSPVVIRLTVMLYIRYPPSLRQVEDILFERGIDICHETVRYWWNRFGPMFAAELRKRRIRHRSYSHYERLLSDKLLRLPMLTDLRSNFALRTIKSGGPLPLSDEMAVPRA